MASMFITRTEKTIVPYLSPNQEIFSGNNFLNGEICPNIITESIHTLFQKSGSSFIVQKFIEPLTPPTIEAPIEQSSPLSFLALEDSFCSAGKKHIDDLEKGQVDCIRAGAGKSKVCLFPNVVIKKLTDDSPSERRKNDLSAQKIIESNGYRHLVVPSSCLHNGYSINQRLPIKNYQKESIAWSSIWLSYKHQQAFTKAVEEFTEFLMKVSMGDIIGGTKSYNRALFPDWIALPRFDNIMLFLDENDLRVGKIGLVDLEHFSDRLAGESESLSAFVAAQQAIQFFPYQFETIIATARKWNPNIDLKKLQALRDSQIKLFEDGVINFGRFLEANPLSIENIDKRKPIIYNIDRKKRLEERIMQEIQPILDSLSIDSTKVREVLFRQDKLYIFLKDFEKTLQNLLLLSYPDHAEDLLKDLILLMDERVAFVSYNREMSDALMDLLIPDIFPKQQRFCMTSTCNVDLTEKIIDIAMADWLQEGDIACFLKPVNNAVDYNAHFCL